MINPDLREVYADQKNALAETLQSYYNMKNYKRNITSAAPATRRRLLLKNMCLTELECDLDLAG